MKEKPYRTNQSSLSKFLEKKAEPPTNKNFERSKDLQTMFYTKLVRIAAKAHDTNDFETLARLDATGCVVNTGTILSLEHLPRRTYEFFRSLENSDQSTNYRNSNRHYYRLWGTGTSLVKSESYTVAGKTYVTKTEFYLQRTELGRALS